MESKNPKCENEISRTRAFSCGICDSLPGILLPIPFMFGALFGLKQMGYEVCQMTAVFAFFPFLFGWWVVLLCGIGYAVFRIGHQRRVFWLTVSFGLVYGGLIPCWILLHDLLAGPN